MITFSQSRLQTPWSRPTSGFSLVELLTVIAVIAILIAILVPVASTVRDSALRGKTRSQLAQYATAYEAFRADQGHYPSMGAPGAEFSLRGNNAVFIETLSGFSMDGQAPSHPYALRANPRRIRYYTFTSNEFARPGEPHAGELVEAFGNPNIHVVIDRQGTGVVRASDFASLPSDRRPETLAGGVFFFVTNPENNPEWSWLTTWD
jgi:prepilin-type N-terminal cleavage/methylation domain-containing protein